MKSAVLIPIGALMLTALWCSTADANLLTNGSFESPVVTPGSFSNFNTGSTGITGWTVVGPQASVVSGSFVQSGISFPAQDGLQWVDLTGDGANSLLNGLKQTVATVPGTTYALSFWVGNVVDPNGLFGTSSTVDLSINGGLPTGYTNSAGVGTHSQNWEQFTTSFVASSASTTVTFLNGDPRGDNSNGLDNVVLSGAPATSVPEPATLGLMGLGLAALGFARRRRMS